MYYLHKLCRSSAPRPFLNRSFSASKTPFKNQLLIFLEFSKFNWEDPLNLKDQLSEDEQNIMEMTHKYCQESLMPRVLEAYRHESIITMTFISLFMFTRYL